MSSIIAVDKKLSSIVDIEPHITLRFDEMSNTTRQRVAQLVRTLYCEFSASSIVGELTYLLRQELPISYSLVPVEFWHYMQPEEKIQTENMLLLGGVKLVLLELWIGLPAELYFVAVSDYEKWRARPAPASNIMNIINPRHAGDYKHTIEAFRKIFEARLVQWRVEHLTDTQRRFREHLLNGAVAARPVKYVGGETCG